MRDGTPERAPVLRLDRMTPIHPELPDGLRLAPPPVHAPFLRTAEPAAPRYGAPPAGPPLAGLPHAGSPYAGSPYAGSPHAGSPRPGALHEAPSFEWTTTLDPAWMPALERIARAVRQVETEWHSLFLAIAGALLARGAEPEDLPLLCRAISMLTGADDRPDDRELAGRSTAERSVLGTPAMGLSTLRRRWPAVAAAFGPTTPLGFRDLVALFEAAGGSRPLATLAGVEHEHILALLRGEPPRGELARALHRLRDVTLPVR
ncbi:MAG: hypothetical protein EOO75_06625 [Myxococcales bacterium]|nr:MAG: hypothetical protein EOO75_06625 [Myxococcales bacterium]